MTEQFEFGTGEIVWEPSEEYLAESRLLRFMARHGIDSWDELMARSTQDIAWFWEATLDDLGIEFYEPYDTVVDLSEGKPWAKWCVGGKMNIIHNCLDRWMGTATQNRAALRWEGEEGFTRVLTYRDLWAEVNRTANALRELGLGKGDAVGLYMPMLPETAIALLAIAKIGGIILPLFSGYGAGAVATRLNDAEAKALFTVDGFFRRGHYVATKRTADEAMSEVPSVEHVVVRHRGGEDAPWTAGRDHWWHDLVFRQPIQAETERTDAEDVVMVIYTSGTTGRPKGAVHTHCGFPIKAAQDLAHGFDLKPSDTLYWMSDMGWMMGPWEVFGTLIIGASMLFYDGAPDFPDVNRVWQLVERHGVTGIGVSPTLVRALRPYGEAPIRAHDLSTLRWAGSTGSPWDPESWMWFFETVLQGRKPILNYSGGTEVSGGIVLGNVIRPLKPTAFSGPAPGIAADVFNEQGQPVRNQVGELVVRQPWIGMTRGFWHDPERYIETYWSRWPDVWIHGDWAARDEDDLWYILGRSDDPIKVGGKRLGPAEVEAVLVSHPAVAEAAAVGVPDPVKGQEVVAFCVLAPSLVPDEEAGGTLRSDLVELVTARLGKPLKPRDVRFVRALPKTRNAKVMRRVIRAAYLGEDLGDLSSLEDPATIDDIRESV
jgi:acetyl-CoA synthetase